MQKSRNAKYGYSDTKSLKNLIMSAFLSAKTGLLVEKKPPFKKILNETYFRTCTSALGFDREIV